VPGALPLSDTTNCGRDLLHFRAILLGIRRHAAAFGEVLSINDLNVPEGERPDYPFVEEPPDTVDGNPEAYGYCRYSPSLKEIKMNRPPLNV
jgi:hypothetical protein